MDRRVSFRNSRIAKIINLATCNTAEMTPQGNIEAGIAETEVNTCDDDAGSNVREPIEESPPEKHNECPVTPPHVQHSPISVQTYNDGARYNVREQIEESLPEKHNECAVTPLNVQQSPVSVQTNENASKNYSENLGVSDSSDDGDFGSSSSDDYICGTDESSSATSVERTQAKRSRTATSLRGNITVPETPSPEHQRVNINTSESAPDSYFWRRNGMNSNEKNKKTRKSMKERREERVKRKLFHNTGLEYSTTSGKIKNRRELRDLENCRQKCKERLPLHLRKNLFETYWSLGSYEKRIDYIAKCIEVCRKKTSKSSPKKKRNVTFRYFVHSHDHKTHPSAIS